MVNVCLWLVFVCKNSGTADVSVRDSIACDTCCASACVNEFASDSAMRTAIYNSMK